MIFTNKQKPTKRQENKHTLKYTIHKPSKQQDKITDGIQTPQRILVALKRDKFKTTKFVKFHKLG